MIVHSRDIVCSGMLALRAQGIANGSPAHSLGNLLCETVEGQVLKELEIEEKTES